MHMFRATQLFVYLAGFILSVKSTEAGNRTVEMCPMERPANSKIRWAPVTFNAFNLGALVVGYEHPHSEIYALRSRHDNGHVIGKAKSTGISTFYHKFYAIHGQMHVPKEYEILVVPRDEVRWDITHDSNIPDGAVVAGCHPVTQEPIYVGRMAVGGELLPGYVTRSSGKCYTELHGEQSSSLYEVLVDLSQLGAEIKSPELKPTQMVASVQKPEASHSALASTAIKSSAGFTLQTSSVLTNYLAMLGMLITCLV